MAAALPFGFYLLSFIAYAMHFSRRTPAAGRAATTLLVAGALAHTFIIGMQTMEAGHVPFAGTTQAISTFVWVLCLAYLYVEVTTEERALGVFVLAIIVGLQALPAMREPGVEPQSPVLEHPLFWTHVSALLGAYASFGLAAVIGITYLLQFKELKAKHLVFFFTRLPSLQTLDVMNSRTVFIGWLLLTVGLGAGALWVREATAIAPGDARVQAMSLGDPKIFVALVTWAVYTFQLVARQTIGWRGRRSAYLSALGFVIVLLNFVLVSYFLTDSHNFGARRMAPYGEGGLRPEAALRAEGGPAAGGRGLAAGAALPPMGPTARSAALRRSRPSGAAGPRAERALREAAFRRSRPSREARRPRSGPPAERSEPGLPRRVAPRPS